jgi:hypothetical protein
MEEELLEIEIWFEFGRHTRTGDRQEKGETA